MNRRHRLRGRAAFAAVRARRASASAAGLRVGVAPGRGGVARVGFAVPRSVGTAVVRNRLRRRLREALRPHLPGLAGYHVVVSAAAPAAALGWRDLVVSLGGCLERARGRLASAAAEGGAGGAGVR